MKKKIQIFRILTALERIFYRLSLNTLSEPEPCFIGYPLYGSTFRPHCGTMNLLPDRYVRSFRGELFGRLGFSSAPRGDFWYFPCTRSGARRTSSILNCCEAIQSGIGHRAQYKYGVNGNLVPMMQCGQDYYCYYRETDRFETLETCLQSLFGPGACHLPKGSRVM